MNFQKYAFQSLRFFIVSALIFAIGCGSSSMAPTLTSATQTPATSSASPGTSSGSVNNGNGSSSIGGSSGTGGAGTSTPVSQPTGFLYVALNDGYSIWTNVFNSGHGSIAGFSIAADGSLQGTPGSPYAGPAASLATNAAASSLYSASQSTLDVNHINADGSLTLTATFNAQPLSPSIGVYEDLSFNSVSRFLYAVAIHGAGDNFFEIYKSGTDGGLTSSGSEQATVSATHPSFTPDGARAYEPYCYHMDGEILGYSASENGQLVAFNTGATVSNLGTPDTACPHALSISSDGSRIAAQLNAVNGTAAALALYTINNDGTLNQQGNLVATSAHGADIAWDPSGRYIAVAAKDGLWIYAASGSTATAMGGRPVVTGPIDHLAFNKAGTLLFATNANSQILYAFAFNGTSGTIAPAPGSPHTMNLPPYALVVWEP
jgi:6-phosphogluconolactonase (cycloisomerase 2 family)